MTPAHTRFAKSAASNAAFFTIAAVVFIGFTIFYTRAYGVAQYGQFSFLLNTVTALISLGAYEGFLITHSVTQTRAEFDRFNRRFAYFNAGLVVIAAIGFVAATGILTLSVLGAVLLAVFLDYRSQSSIAVLITRDDNWKIRAFRTAYQVILIAMFVAARTAGIDLAHAFALAILGAATINYGLLITAAASGLAQSELKPTMREAVTAKVLWIAVATNVATVLFLLIDKIAVRWFDVGTDYQVGLYFLFFDLAVRAEAFYLLLAVPVTNHLFNKAQGGELASREILWMAAGCVGVGAVAGILGIAFVPPIYGVSLEGIEMLPWLFGIYVTARGIRHLLKAVCNATGLHWTLLAANYLVLIAGSIAVAVLLLTGGGVLSITALAAVLALAQLGRAPFLFRILVHRAGFRERLVLGKA